jgi:hypothetical protein
MVYFLSPGQGWHRRANAQKRYKCPLTVLPAQALPALVALVPGAPQDVGGLVASAFCNLSWDPQSQMRLVDRGAVGAVVELAKSRDPSTRRTCALVLCNASLQRVNHAGAMRAGAAQALYSLVSDDMPSDMRSLIARAVRNFSTAAASRAQLVREGLMNALNALVRDGDAAVLEDVAVVLSNAAKEESVHVMLVRGGAVALVSFLVKSAPPRTLSLVVGAMVNLTRLVQVRIPHMHCQTGLLNCLPHSQLRKKLVEDGAVRILTSISRADPEVCSAKAQTHTHTHTHTRTHTHTDTHTRKHIAHTHTPTVRPIFHRPRTGLAVHFVFVFGAVVMHVAAGENAVRCCIVSAVIHPRKPSKSMCMRARASSRAKHGVGAHTGA